MRTHSSHNQYVSSTWPCDLEPDFRNFQNPNTHTDTAPPQESTQIQTQIFWKQIFGIWLKSHQQSGRNYRCLLTTCFNFFMEFLPNSVILMSVRFGAANLLQSIPTKVPTLSALVRFYNIQLTYLLPPQPKHSIACQRTNNLRRKNKHQRRLLL